MTRRLLAVLLLAALSMGATYTPDVRVQVLIEARTPDGVYKDAIYMTKAEFDAASDAQITAMKAARVTAWRAAVAAARTRPPVTPTRAELQAERDRLAAELAAVEERLSR